jgi:hypothetical protein
LLLPTLPLNRRFTAVEEAGYGPIDVTRVQRRFRASAA